MAAAAIAAAQKHREKVRHIGWVAAQTGDGLSRAHIGLKPALTAHSYLQQQLKKKQNGEGDDHIDRTDAQIMQGPSTRVATALMRP